QRAQKHDGRATCHPPKARHRTGAHRDRLLLEGQLLTLGSGAGPVNSATAPRCKPRGLGHIVAFVCPGSFRSTMTSSSVPAGPLVVLDDIRLTLASAAGPVDILRGISLTIAAGETVALLGPSGSGKSSLLMVLAGLERPSAGRVRLAGQDLAALNEDGLARLRRDHVGIVFPSFYLIATMTALKNFAIPLERAAARAALAAAEAALARVGLGHRLSHYPGQLSGGEQQRVAIARGMGAGPGVLLADE